MAQRDYVKKKAKAKSHSRIIQNLMITIAIILVILFVAILYFVSTNKTNKPPYNPTSITEKPKSTLPDKPQERWTYLKELENPNGNNQTSTAQSSSQAQERKQILDNFINDKQPTTTTTVDNSKIEQPKSQVNISEKTGSWILQCGAFKDKANAESLKAKLAMFGINGFVKNAQFYRVFVGPYSSKAEADTVIAMLKNNGTTDCITMPK